MTGWAMLCSSSVQEAHDLALIAQNATLASRIPFVHFFDGFRTSHEVSKIEMLDDDDVRAMIDDELVFAHRQRALDPERPVIRGVAQNPDVYFQGRETVNPYYAAVPAARADVDGPVCGADGPAVPRCSTTSARPDADRVIVLMGSGVETARETIEYLNARGAKRRRRAGPPVPAVLGRRPARAMPSRDSPGHCRARPDARNRAPWASRSTRTSSRRSPRASPADRAPAHAAHPRRALRAVVEGIHAGDGEGGVRQPGLRLTRRTTSPSASPTTCRTPACECDPDVHHRRRRRSSAASSTAWAPTAPSGANKNSIKIIGEETSGYAQGFFVYDSKKSGSRTTSHLRFGPRPIRSTYLVQRARFIACHQFSVRRPGRTCCARPSTARCSC